MRGKKENHTYEQKTVITIILERFKPIIHLSQIWRKRQEKQWVLAEPVLMEEVERTNIVVVRTPL